MDDRAGAASISMNITKALERKKRSKKKKKKKEQKNKKKQQTMLFFTLVFVAETADFDMPSSSLL
jgi:hypothetical protein